MPPTDFLCTTTRHYCKSSILAQIISRSQQTHLKGAEENQRPPLQYEETQRSSLQSSLNNSTPPSACPGLLGTAVAKGTVDFIFGKQSSCCKAATSMPAVRSPTRATSRKNEMKCLWWCLRSSSRCLIFNLLFLWFSDGEKKKVGKE